MPAAASFELDKQSFSEQWNVFAVKVPAKLCNDTRKVLKNHVLSIPRVLSVVQPTAEEIPDKTLLPVVVVLLKYLTNEPSSRYRAPPRGNTDQSIAGSDAELVASNLRVTEIPAKTPADVAAFVKGTKGSDIVTRDVDIAYEHWTLDDVLRNLLPEDVTVPTSFETVGHIAHLNLRAEHEPHKATIGKVMLDKLQPRVKTIVNKLQSTGGPYRTFAMEVLAGDPNLETTLKENGCTFRLDFSKVYWNSRLETEHRKIITSLKRDDILADAFCGIGPFTVPAARQKKCRKIYANDLNPSSVRYLKENAKLNHIDESCFITSCSCAREFLKRLVQIEKVPITRVVMNFPSGAPEFLDAFRGLYDEVEDQDLPMPLVHCYCFVKGTGDLDSARNRVRKALYGEDEASASMMTDSLIAVRDVRDVAPRKRQVCVSFQVPKNVAYTQRKDKLRESSPPAKKLRLAD